MSTAVATSDAVALASTCPLLKAASADVGQRHMTVAKEVPRTDRLEGAKLQGAPYQAVPVCGGGITHHHATGLSMPQDRASPKAMCLSLKGRILYHVGAPQWVGVGKVAEAREG
jgi:hypothetical protein